MVLLLRGGGGYYYDSNISDDWSRDAPPKRSDKSNFKMLTPPIYYYAVPAVPTHPSVHCRSAGRCRAQGRCHLPPSASISWHRHWGWLRGAPDRPLRTHWCPGNLGISWVCWVCLQYSQRCSSKCASSFAAPFGKHCKICEGFIMLYPMAASPGPVQRPRKLAAKGPARAKSPWNLFRRPRGGTVHSWAQDVQPNFVSRCRKGFH